MKGERVFLRAFVFLESRRSRPHGALLDFHGKILIEKVRRFDADSPALLAPFAWIHSHATPVELSHSAAHAPGVALAHAEIMDFFTTAENAELAGVFLQLYFLDDLF